jgi:tRNA A64-2'-O-ribosylphosphate transferase
VRPETKKCYFKSTDGHFGQWSFSFTRLNLHLALGAFKSSGALVVDSTRKGKSFPDSMVNIVSPFVRECG